MAVDVKRGRRRRDKHKRKRKKVPRKHECDHVYTFSRMCMWQYLYINKI